MVIFRDFFSLSSPNQVGGPSADPEVREKALAGKGLIVTMTASHAGKLTKNFGLYMPKMMKSAANTFVLPYQKPVQVHHQGESDAIGRVIGARYVPYDKSTLSQDALHVSYMLEDAKTKDSMLKAAREMEKSGVLFRRDWRGVGELELKAYIADSLAVQKFLDGRYMTVSVSLDPHTAYCSICGKDIVSEGFCEHERGMKDSETGRVAYWIPGSAEYGEVSPVNRPADPDAMTKEMEMAERAFFADSEGTYLSIDKEDNGRVTYEIVDSISEGTLNMETENKQEVTEPEDPTVEDGDQGDKNEDETQPVWLAPILQDIQGIKETLAELTAAKDEEEDSEDGPEEDAKLTTKKRKALPKSSFCGPDESYPADTRARGANALSRVKQHGSPALQKRVKACVCRKYPSLPSCGQDSAELDEVEWTDETAEELKSEFVHPETGEKTTLGDYIFGVGETFEDTEEPEEPKEKDNTKSCLLTDLSDEDILVIKDDLEKELVKRELNKVEPCKACEDKDAEIQGLKDGAAVLNKELSLFKSDNLAADKALEEMTKKLHKAYKDSILKFKLMTDKDTSAEDLEKTVAELSIEDAEKVIETLDLSGLIDTARSGMTNEPAPDGQVRMEDAEDMDEDEIDNRIEDSTGEDKKPEPPEFDDTTAVQISNIVKMIDSRGEEFAMRRLDALRRVGKISSDYTLAKAREFVQNLSTKER